MKQTLLFSLLLFAGTLAAQPTIWGGAKLKLEQGDTAFISNLGAVKTWLGLSGGGTVSSVSGVDDNGFDFTIANPTTTPAITLNTTVSGMVKGSSGDLVAATAGTDYSAGTSALATGILKSTTSTGNLTIAVAGDFPTLNQNTTGSAATLTTPRAIYGNNFDGSAALTQVIASTYGGTGNGFTKFSGPTTSEKTFTLPNASATILTDNAAVTVAQGGSGATTLTGVLVGNGTSAFTAATSSTVGQVLRVTGANTYALGAVDLADGDAVTGALPVANGGTALTSVGSDVTLLGSNGSANIYYTPAITHNDAAFGYSRATATMNLNIPNATASLGGIVSTGTQTIAGAKTFSSLLTGSAGLVGTATASVASVNLKGPLDGDFTTVTATTTVSETYYEYFVGTLTADIDLDLPACNATRDGWTWRFTKKGTDAFAFVLDPNGAETFFDGAATKTYFGQGNSVTCQCENGLGWNILR